MPDPHADRSAGAGDPPEDPARLHHMADRQAWEEALRGSFTAQVRQAPAPRADLSAAAINRARRRHRRHTVAGMAAVAAAVVLATTGVWVAGWPGGGGDRYGAVSGVIADAPSSPTPEPVPRLAAGPELPSRLAVELIGESTAGGTVLAGPDGDALPLPGVRGVTAAQRLPGGWAAVSGARGAQRLWWLTPGEPPVSLLAGMDAITMAGQRVAWQQGSLLAAATLTGGALTGRVSTAGPRDGGHPAGLLGDTVLLRRPDPAGDDAWDVWQPAGGDYTPGWRPGVVRVYGPLAGGRAAVGLVADSDGGRHCLAVLDPNRRLAPTDRHCPADPGGDLAALRPELPGTVSPDGRWLLAGAGDRTILVELRQLAQSADGPPVHPVPQLAAPDSPPQWLAADQVLVDAGADLARLRPERLRTGATGAVERFPLTGPRPVVVHPG